MYSKIIEPIAQNFKNCEVRNCFPSLCDFIDNHNEVSSSYYGRIAVLYGLRRTGKTFLMQQLYLEYGKEHCTMLGCHDNMSMDNIYSDIDECVKAGKDIILLDEITLVSDFVTDSAYLADKYAKEGVAIITAGTDSLSFVLAEKGPLFDRTFGISCTYISFAEHARVMNTKDIDSYIMYGGLMSMGANDTLADEDRPSAFARHYLDSAVSANIAHSLKNADITAGFSEISKYSESDLTVIINRLTELYTGSFITATANRIPKRPIVTKAIDTLSDSYHHRINGADYTPVLRKELKSEYLENINAIKELSKPATEELMNELERTLRMLGVASDTINP